MKIAINGHVSDADAAWRLIGDTDFLNRIAGNGKMLEISVTDADGRARLGGVWDGPFGVRIPFREVHNSWVSGRYIRQERRFTGPGPEGSVFSARLEPKGGGVVPVVELELQGGGMLIKPIVAQRARAIERAWKDALDALPAPGGAVRTEASDLAPQAERALSEWKKTSDDAMVTRFRSLFRRSRPAEMQQLRAFQLADRWALDRESVLVAMLQGVKVGALELYWAVRCPRCRGPMQSAQTLSDIAEHAACPICRIDTSTDLGKNVEAMFAPHPAIVPRAEGKFCTINPAVSPDQYALLDVPAGATFKEKVPLGVGDWYIGAMAPVAELAVRIANDGAVDEVVRYVVAKPGEGARARPGDVPIEIVNAGAEPMRVQVVSANEPEDRVPASLLTTLPAFRRQMGHQVLATNTRISVRNVAILFTDLTGSTAMYEDVGDAEAYALVRDHFTVLRSAVEAHRGVIVKTIGDAVMAAFHSAADAVSAAFAMHANFDTWKKSRAGAEMLGLKIGVHVGPSLVVHSDQAGLDYFGRTVNIAARVQGVSGGGEIVWSGAMQGDEGVRELVREKGLRPEAIKAELKGVREDVGLYKVKT